MTSQEAIHTKPESLHPDELSHSLVHQIVLQTLIPGRVMRFSISDVIATLPSQQHLDMATRTADTPVTIRSVGVAEQNTRGLKKTINPHQLADQLRNIPLNIHDEIELFLPSQPRDLYVLRFALDPYYLALHGRAPLDAAAFARLCFVTQNSADPTGLDEAIAFRLWVKTNSKPFSQQEFFARFPFPKSRWSHFRSLKSQLKLNAVRTPACEPAENNPVHTESPESLAFQRLLQDGNFENAATLWATGVEALASITTPPPPYGAG